ncbi:MAG: hypothetical protein JSV62_01995 [Promethearchaeota archaeon]|nr:MAG: hypothetical protein JSV62_01995 [Candidatus Lokiarchaeota archaeon]
MKEGESNLNMLKSQIHKLKLELAKKDQEINSYYEKIHDNEEELMKLHELISKTPSQENYQKLIETKFNFELREKEREIRDLKNRMGFLRQEKTTLQRELEELKNRNNSSALSIEVIRENQRKINQLLNLETLTVELRKELYMQETLLRNFKKEIAKKNEQIKHLNLTVKELNQELRTKNSILESNVNKKLKRELIAGVQKELDKYEKEAKDLRNKLKEYQKNKGEKIKFEIEISELKNKINFLENELENKDRKISELTSQK